MFESWNDLYQIQRYFTTTPREPEPAPTPITCTGCGCKGPTACECDGDRLYAAQSRIVDLEFALREALSLAAYYCPEELQRSLSGETAALRDYLDHDEDEE